MISRTSLHAIRALAALATRPPDRCVGAASLAQEIGAPPNYLGKLLLALAREGVVESRKGSGGGYRLARESRAIRLIDVIDTIEPLGRWDGCFLGHPICSDDTACAVHQRWTELRNGYVSLLSNTTIADLIAPRTEEP